MGRVSLLRKSSGRRAGSSVRVAGEHRDDHRRGEQVQRHERGPGRGVGRQCDRRNARQDDERGRDPQEPPTCAVLRRFQIASSTRVTPPRNVIGAEPAQRHHLVVHREWDSRGVDRGRLTAVVIAAISAPTAMVATTRILLSGSTARRVLWSVWRRSSLVLGSPAPVALLTSSTNEQRTCIDNRLLKKFVELRVDFGRTRS